jgi:hypothetical protein
MPPPQPGDIWALLSQREGRLFANPGTPDPERGEDPQGLGGILVHPRGGGRATSVRLRRLGGWNDPIRRSALE